MTTASETSTARLDVLHAIVVGAAVLGFIFVICWATEALGFAPAGRLVSLFAGETGSIAARAQGLPWAIGVGALTGASVASFSNGLRFLVRRAPKPGA